MQLLTRDYETYYSDTFGFKTMSTLQYVRHPDFQVVGVAYKFDDGPTEWVHGPQRVRDWIESIDYSKIITLGHNCLLGSAEVLTPEGWVRLDSISEGDTVMQWNPDSEMLTWTPVQKVHRAVAGKMLRWRGNYHAAHYTFNHRMFVNTTDVRTWVAEAAERVAGRGMNNTYVPTAGSFLPDEHIDISRSEAALMEAIRADGSWGFDGPGSGVRFKFSKVRKLERLEQLVNNVGGHMTVRQEGGRPEVSVVYLHSCEAVAKARELLGHDKVYGPWVLSLPYSARVGILTEAEYWDGHTNPGSKTGYQYSTADELTATWFQVMGHITDRTVSVRSHDNERGFTSGQGPRDIFQGTVRTRSRVRLVTAPEVVEGREEVWCITVPTGAFMVRSEGRVFITGNSKFDGAIDKWIYGKDPVAILDTLSMARSLGLDFAAGGSLDGLLKLFRANGYDHLPEKGTEIVNAKGLRYEDFTPDGIYRYGQYAKTDVEGCYGIYKIMRPMLPTHEMVWQDQVLRMYIDSIWRLDKPMLEMDLDRVITRREETLARVANMLNLDPPITFERVQGTLMSNEKFAEALRALGGRTKDEEGDRLFTIPQKISPRTGKVAWAFSKTDKDFQKLLEHDNEQVQAVASARVGTKSTIEESRLIRMIAAADTPPYPLPYKVSGAHTHRLSGDENENSQNWPSGRVPGQSTAIRDSVMAPEDHVAVVGDSSQIEARYVAYIAGQEDMLEIFRRKEDPYSHMAVNIFGSDYTTIREGARAGEEPYSNIWRPVGKAAVLQLGFQAGAVKFHDYINSVARVPMSEEQAMHVVQVYRQVNARIRAFWYRCEEVIAAMIDGGKGHFGGPYDNLFFYTGDRWLFGVRTPGIRLPDGMWLNYPNLRRETVPSTPEDTLLAKEGRPHETKQSYVYDKRRGRGKELKFLYGGALTENLTQAGAFGLLKWQGLKIAERWQLRLNTHDEHAIIVPKTVAEEAKLYVEECLQSVPSYYQGLPVGCEVGYNERYGRAG